MVNPPVANHPVRETRSPIKDTYPVRPFRLAIPNRFVGNTVVALRAIAGCPLPYGESRREDGGTRATFQSLPPQPASAGLLAVALGFIPGRRQ